MNTFNETFEKLASFSPMGLTPSRELAEAAADSFEKIARKNYDVFGDFVDFAVSQARLPVSATAPQDFFASQMASTREFVEQLNVRVNEYAELGQEFKAAATRSAEAEVAAPARKKTRTSRRKAA